MGSRTPSESGGGFEESYEKVTEEGDSSGARLVRLDKITVRHRVEEVVRPRVLSRDSRTPSEEILDRRNARTPSREGIHEESLDRVAALHRMEEARSVRAHEHVLPTPHRTWSRTPSEELLDSSYFTHNGSLSKSSSQQSLDNTRRSFSREMLDWDQGSVGSGTGSSRGGEWYNEYRSQSFQNFNSKLERVLTRQEYDTHIAEIKGKSMPWLFFTLRA